MHVNRDQLTRGTPCKHAVMNGTHTAVHYGLPERAGSCLILKKFRDIGDEEERSDDVVGVPTEERFATRRHRRQGQVSVIHQRNQPSVRCSDDGLDHTRRIISNCAASDEFDEEGLHNGVRLDRSDEHRGINEASISIPKGGTHRHARAHARFMRTLTLPTGASGEDISASYKDGILEVAVPMREAQGEVQRVAVSRPTS